MVIQEKIEIINYKEHLGIFSIYKYDEKQEIFECIVASLKNFFYSIRIYGKRTLIVVSVHTLDIATFRSCIRVLFYREDYAFILINALFATICVFENRVFTFHSVLQSSRYLCILFIYVQLEIFSNYETFNISVKSMHTHSNKS